MVASIDNSFGGMLKAFLDNQVEFAGGTSLQKAVNEALIKSRDAAKVCLVKNGGRH